MTLKAMVGTGTTIVFGTSGFTAEILSVNGNDVSINAIDASHMGSSGSREKIFGTLVDEGEVEFEFAFDPDSQPPIGEAAETITITFPVPEGGSTGAKVAGTGKITKWSWSDPLEEKMTAQATITWDGQTGPTWTASA